MERRLAQQQLGATLSLPFAPYPAKPQRWLFVRTHALSKLPAPGIAMHDANSARESCRGLSDQQI